MKDLLEEKDLRNNERVIAAYWGLKGNNPPPKEYICDCCGAYVKCYWDDIQNMYYGKCKRGTSIQNEIYVFNYVPGSLADIAFEMRDACVRKGLALGWQEMLEIQKPNVMHAKEDWIHAAVLAWEAQNEKA